MARLRSDPAALQLNFAFLLGESSESGSEDTEEHSEEADNDSEGEDYRYFIFNLPRISRIGYPASLITGVTRHSPKPSKRADNEPLS